MKDKLLIIGAGGHGKVVADIALKINQWNSIAFLDDNERDKSIMGLEIIGNLSSVKRYIDQYQIFAGIGNNVKRQEVQSMLENLGASIPILIHPNSTIGEQVEIGHGTAVMAGAVINSCSKVGKGCIINTGSTIDHDNSIEDFVHISPGAHLAGTVNIGQGSWLGIGSIVSNNVRITGACKVGAGAVVIKDINESGVYMGVPAKRLY